MSCISSLSLLVKFVIACIVYIYFFITDSPETRQLMKSARKQFGLGLNLGYGLNMGANGINPGVYVGVGLHYSPRFLQFGK